MRFNRHIIAPFKTGLQTDLRPWMIPEDAFEDLRNAYVFRGRVRKRFGSFLMGFGASAVWTAYLQSRLAHDIDTTDALGDASGTAPGNIFKLGQQFSIGTAIFTVIDDTPGPQDMLRSDGVVATATFDVSNGNYVINGATALFPVYFFTAEPVMGLTNYEQGPVNNQPSYAFDTQFAYLYANGFWLKSVGSPTWNGSNSDFYWATNWRGIAAENTTMYVTNFNVLDPIYTFDGTTWASYVPYIAPTAGPQTGPFVRTCRMILPFKGSLLLLSPIVDDGAGNYAEYKNRVIFSAIGNPFADNAWYFPNQFDNSGGTNSTAVGAGFADASTEEEIISAEFIKDRLIVYFERSTWELAYTQSDTFPFLWQKINTELGAESTFSTVPFDKVILTIGNVGVHGCSGSNVERIDNKIPDQVFQFKNKNEGPGRVYGIRDYYVEMVYWSYPSDNENPSEVYPNKVLVYNYRNGTWSVNDDCITAFGYFEQQLDTTWGNSQFTWEETNNTWESGVLQSAFRQVIAGNQQGFVFIVSPDTSRNAPVMSITNMDIIGNGYVDLTIIDHCLTVGEFISVENPIGIAQPLRGIYKVTRFNNVNSVRIYAPDITGDYVGGGTSARVSNLGILSKQWNPYVKKGFNFYLGKIDFCVLKTTQGKVSVDYFVAAAELSMVGEATDSGAILGDNVLETSPYPGVPYEKEQQRLWHPIYFQADGEFVQILIYMSDAQITTPALAWSDFELEGIVLHTVPAADRLQTGL